MLNYLSILDPESTAAALLDGGWTSADYDQIMTEFALSPEDAFVVCYYMDVLANYDYELLPYATF